MESISSLFLLFGTMDDIMFDSGEKFTDVSVSCTFIYMWVLWASCNVIVGMGGPIALRYLVITFLLNVFEDINSSVYKVFLRKHRFENLLAIIEVNTMQVFSLDLLFRHDEITVEEAELWNMIQDLAPVMLLVLDRIEAKIKLGEKFQSIDILQLIYLDDGVKGKV